MTADQVAAASPDRPACLYADDFFHPLMREAYVETAGHLHDCWVAWVGDTGASTAFNIDAAWDKYEIYVKHGGDVTAVIWVPLGSGVGPLAGGASPSLDDYDLALDGTATGTEAVAPVVAWVQDMSCHWGQLDLYAARWDGSAWQPMETVDGSTRLNALPAPGGFQNKPLASLPKLSRTDDGHLALTWTEAFNGPPARYQRTWDGQVWSAAQQLP